MEAQPLPDGRVKLILTHQEFGILNNSIIEVRSALAGNEAFVDRIGLSKEQAGSLFDEFLLLRYEKFGEPRPIDPRTGYAWWSSTEPRATGTAWDGLPKMDGELLLDGRVMLTLARGELRIFRNVVRGMLDTLRWDEREMAVRMRVSVGAAETMLAGLERLRQQVGREESGTS
jgi:hypothetical protein